MRIAVCGTHRCGKTTLVEAFARAHPAYRVVPEPYEGMQEELGADPPDDRSPESFLAQLHYMVGVLDAHPADAPAIFDRCPLDFLAYLRAVDQFDLGTSDWAVSDETLEAVGAGLSRLDVIAFVRPDAGRGRDRRPGHAGNGFDRDAGHEAGQGPPRGLRALVDAYLAELVLDDVLGLLGGPGAPAVHELPGTTVERVATLTRLAARG